MQFYRRILYGRGFFPCITIINQQPGLPICTHKCFIKQKQESSPLLPPCFCLFCVHSDLPLIQILFLCFSAWFPLFLCLLRALYQMSLAVIKLHDFGIQPIHFLAALTDCFDICIFIAPAQCINQRLMAGNPVCRGHLPARYIAVGSSGPASRPPADISSEFHFFLSR